MFACCCWPRCRCVKCVDSPLPPVDDCRPQLSCSGDDDTPNALLDDGGRESEEGREEAVGEDSRAAAEGREGRREGEAAELEACRCCCCCCCCCSTWSSCCCCWACSGDWNGIIDDGTNSERLQQAEATAETEARKRAPFK